MPRAEEMKSHFNPILFQAQPMSLISAADLVREATIFTA